MKIFNPFTIFVLVIICIIVPLYFFNCFRDPIDPALDKQHQSSIAENLSRNLVYYKDTRTGVCFAAIDQYYYNPEHFVYIPCNPDIEKIATKFPIVGSK